MRELKLQEVLNIVEAVANQETYIQRKMVKDVLLVEVLMEKEIIKENTSVTVELYESIIDDINLVYENCANDGLIDLQVASILENRRVNASIEIKDMIQNALSVINGKIEEYENNAKIDGVDLQSLVEQMKDKVK